MSRRIMYGVGYDPIEGLGEDLADVGDILDFVDPLGLRKVPGKIKDKVDNYIESKSQRAATVASQKVEAGVRRAMDDAGSKAMGWAAGGVLLGATVAGGIYFYKRAQDEKRGAR